MDGKSLGQALQALVAFALIGWLLLVASFCAGCGPSLQQTRTAYQAEVQRCLDNEHAIVVREGTTATQDTDDMATERARCDAALAVIRHECGRHCR